MHETPLTEVTESCSIFFEKESAKFEEVDAADVEAAQELLKQRIVQPPKVEESDKETDDSKKDRKSTMSRRMTSRTRRRVMRRRLLQRTGEVEVEQETVLEVDPELARRLTPKKRAARILKKTCLEVCKPEICCKDIAGKTVS